MTGRTLPEKRNVPTKFMHKQTQGPCSHNDIGLWNNGVWINYFHCRDDYAHHEFQTSIFYSGTDSSVINDEWW